MSIFGVFLLTSILCVYSTLLLADKIQEKLALLPQIPANIQTKIQDICVYISKPYFREQAGYIALLFGIWNLFGPDFGSYYGGLPIVGALLPSLVLCFDAVILNPELLNWTPLDSIRVQINSYIKQYSPLAGCITLVAAILHSLLYRLPIF